MPTYHVPIVPTRTATARAKGSVSKQHYLRPGLYASDPGLEWVTFEARTHREAAEMLADVWWWEDPRPIRGVHNVRYYRVAEGEAPPEPGQVRIYEGSN